MKLRVVFPLGVAMLALALALMGCAGDPSTPQSQSVSATATTTGEEQTRAVDSTGPCVRELSDVAACAKCHSESAATDTTTVTPCLFGRTTDYHRCECHILNGKPVIYLYPTDTTAVSVRLDVDGQITKTVPRLGGDQTWRVVADPSGRLTESASRRIYPYLFWEAWTTARFDMSSGFVIGGADTRRFLRGALARLGLSPSEASEFMEYWAPRMERSPYNLIRFEGPVYERSARLHVSPRPDTSIRVFMVYAPLSEPVEVEQQTLPEPPKRRGFVLIEWGSTELPAR